MRVDMTDADAMRMLIQQFLNKTISGVFLVPRPHS